MHILKKSTIRKKKKNEQESMKNCMFFGTSILDGFWAGFGEVLAGQNPRFSHFFRCFFEAFFKQRFGRPKNRKKMATRRTVKDFWDGLAECAASGGEKKRGGEKAKDVGYLGSKLNIGEYKQEV